MSSKYTQSVTSGKTHFSSAPMAELEFSIMTDNPQHLTTFSAGDIVPVYCAEVLPHDTFKIDLDFVTRQATVAVPVMGQLVQDFYAFFVPNRIVNKSWKNVMGENTSGSWIAPSVSLAPLVTADRGLTYKVPVGSIADYYGFPTQLSIPYTVLGQCHDLKFRGYLEIINNFFRDENYQPPYAYSKLNVYNGFFEPDGSEYSLDGKSGLFVPNLTESDGSFAGGSIVKELFGDGSTNIQGVGGLNKKTSYSMLNRPIKANKLHDYFTSVLPSPQKGRQVALPVRGFAPLNTTDNVSIFDKNLKLSSSSILGNNGDIRNLGINITDNYSGDVVATADHASGTTFANINGSNVVADLGQSGVAISVTDLRLSSAIQRVYEILGNGGSRYTEFINSFFGITVDNPFDDIPMFLGHFRRDLDLFQTAQTSASPSGDVGAGTPQGNLTAYGYTNKGGNFFHKTFNEHGYIHIFTVIRHRNVYPAFLSRDNFRLSMLDFYSYPLANISEQPVYTREINPFNEPSVENPGVFGYQEAWAEYRYEPDRVSGYMRPGIDQSLAMWNYADDFSSDLISADGEFMFSNTEDVVSRSTAIQDRAYPQFKCQLMFHITKERAMPVYSIPGADIF